METKKKVFFFNITMARLPNEAINTIYLEGVLYWLLTNVVDIQNSCASHLDEVLAQMKKLTGIHKCRYLMYFILSLSL